MNKQLKLLAAATILAIAPAAQAATINGNFNVSVTLTPVCAITAGPANVTFTYTSFQAGVANSAGGGFSVACTQNVSYSMSLNAAPTGLVGGLAYTIAAPAGSFTGTGVAVAHTISGTIAGGQGGDVSAPTTEARVLTITY
jgi:hypothetical protein